VQTTKLIIPLEKLGQGEWFVWDGFFIFGRQTGPARGSG